MRSAEALAPAPAGGTSSEGRNLVVDDRADVHDGSQDGRFSLGWARRTLPDGGPSTWVNCRSAWGVRGRVVPGA
ncbi:hypothetical protein FNJ62_12655 [Streptomyces benahoarensis]|uniref:Uncharacterized protein n=1 Tax=Streptomyces benahoarensis TaxID=2595054 RepID=A0A553XNF3_9ACTN|nr:hypothetical protein FNZ23_29660 [Streptomyces benahoarensis]TSB25623.1 hypothetical protein FNJ62_12655 [Streptomyces benahoarensis]